MADKIYPPALRAVIQAKSLLNDLAFNLGDVRETTFEAYDILTQIYAQLNIINEAIRPDIVKVDQNADEHDQPPSGEGSHLGSPV